MIVLGIDPGIGTTGVATVKDNKGSYKLISSEGITTPTKLPHGQRLNMLYQRINSLAQEIKPDVAVLETLFFGNNITTAFSVGQARGVIQLALTQKNIPLVEYNPIKVKMAITGYSKAEKGQIQRMVAQILKLNKPLTPDDIADAAAIALCHCFSYKLHQRTESI